MKKISSGNTFFLKRIFPLLFVLFPIGVIAMMLATKTAKPIPPGALIPPLVIVPVAFLATRRLLMGLADEVLDGGDFLLVRKGGREERIPLTNIMNVSVSLQVNPPRITLRLVNPGRFGDEVAFIPLRETSFLPARRNKIADDLMVRVDRARVNRPR